MIVHNLKQFFIAVDQLCNVVACCLLGEKAYADMTLSAHAWLWYASGTRSWPKNIIDAVLFFDKRHCYEAFQSERLGRQLPPEARQ